MFVALFAISIAMLDGSFAVEGWAPPATPPASGWSSLFRVYAGTGDVPPMLGEYSVTDGRLRFRPLSRYRQASRCGPSLPARDELSPALRSPART